MHFRLIAIAAAIAAATRSGHAQSSTSKFAAVHGTVVELLSRVPIPLVSVQLITNGQAVATRTTNLDGAFVFDSLPRGSFYLRAQRIGYLLSESPALDLITGETRSVILELARPAVRLDSVLVSAERDWKSGSVDPRLDELFDRVQRFRTRKNFVQYVNRDTIDKYAARAFSIDKMLERVFVAGPNNGPACHGSKTFVDGLFTEPTPGFGSVTSLFELTGIGMIETYTFPAIPAEFASPVFEPGVLSIRVPPCRVVSLWRRPEQPRPQRAILSGRQAVLVGVSVVIALLSTQLTR